MKTSVDPSIIANIAPAGHYIALRVGFAFPQAEINKLPQSWVSEYTRERMLLDDPALIHSYHTEGVSRWSELSLPDPRDVFGKAAAHGLAFGAVAAVFDRSSPGLRSYGTFSRADREFHDDELAQLQLILNRLHRDAAPPVGLSEAEIEVLAAIKAGKRLKLVAFELGLTEGAIKQRLKNARTKLGASTGTQAATIAADYGLI